MELKVKINWKNTATNILHAETGLKVQDFRTFEKEGLLEKLSDCVSVVLSKSDFPDPLKILAEIRKKVPSHSYLVFLGHSQSSEEFFSVELVIGQGESQKDIIRLAETNACNYGLDSEQIISALENIGKHAKLEILGADSDSISLGINDAKSNWKQIACELVDLCPDLMQSNLHSTIMELESYLQKNKFIQLWWD